MNLVRAALVSFFPLACSVQTALSSFFSFTPSTFFGFSGVLVAAGETWVTSERVLFGFVVRPRSQELLTGARINVHRQLERSRPS